MKIKFMGAAGTVTGSSYVLTSGSGTSILIDLGMFQGLPEIEKLNNDPYLYDVTQLQGVVLTHAHLDHCGRLPILIPKGFKGPIFMTPPTKDLTSLSLIDSAKIAVQDHKKGLYDKAQVYQTMDRFKTAEYHEPFRVGDFKVTFRDAGHIIGSASLEIEDLVPGVGAKTIVFSGDLGNTPEDLVMATEHPESADVVVMESTYGDRLHGEEDAVAMLQHEINTIEETGATLLIPAFALERTQEVLHMIMHLKKEGKVRSETAVYLDSPMAEEATNIYIDYPQLFNEHIKKDFQDEGTPFGFPGLQIVNKKSVSEALHRRKDESKVIIAGSGMMSGGRILGHAAHYLKYPEHRLLIVGYQGEGTIGRDLMDGKREIVIDKEVIQVKATVSATHAMSSHADQQQLLDWLGAIQQVKKVFLTHGEDPSREALAQKITQLGITEVTMPKMHEEVEV